MHSSFERFEFQQIKECRTNPRLIVLQGFLCNEECDHLIGLVQSRIQPSTTVDPDTGIHILVEGRTSSSAYLTLGQTSIVAGIEQRLATLSGLPVENGEGLQVLNYQVGQNYQPHFDFFDPNLKGSPAILACGGQRVISCLMYLNDVEAGGETHFPEVGHKVAPIKGDALFFYNLLPDGQVDLLSLHASLPVIAGEKWVATKWIREREYRSPQ